MSGVNGGAQLNTATPKRTAETENAVSAIAVPKKPVKTPKIKPETSVEPIITPSQVINAQPANEPETASKPISVTAEINVEKPALEVVANESESYNLNEILTAYAGLENKIKHLYANVFAKAQGFKPTVMQTIADAFNYLYYVLYIKGESAAFKVAFKLNNVTPKAFNSDYTPVCVRLSKWAEDKGLITICEDMLGAITAVYVESVRAIGKNITEEDVANTFSALINFVF